MDLFNLLGGLSNVEQQLGAQLGTDPSQTSAALEAAVPLLLGALTRNASQPAGAQALDQALNQHSGQALELFGQGQMPDVQEGQKILGHIFGSQQNAAAQAIGQRAGIDPKVAMQLLMMLAPLVLNFLSRQRGGSGGGIDIGSILGGLLGGRQSSAGASDQQPQGEVLGGGAVIPGLPNQGTPSNAHLGGMLGSLNKVLDRDGDGNALNDLIGMFAGRRA